MSITAEEIFHDQVEALAKILHEAGREAVLKGCIVRKDVTSVKGFIEWENMDEAGKEGRRIQARFLLHRYNITPIIGKTGPDAPPPPLMTKEAKDIAAGSNPLNFGYGEAETLARQLIAGYLQGKTKWNITEINKDNDNQLIGFLFLATGGYLSTRKLRQHHGYFTFSTKFWQKILSPLHTEKIEKFQSPEKSNIGPKHPMDLTIRYQGQEITKISRKTGEATITVTPCLPSCPIEAGISEKQIPISQELATALENLLIQRHKELGWKNP